MIRTIFILALLFAQHGRTTRDEKVTPMADHVWISTDGDFGAATSWSSGVAPTVSATGTVTCASVLAADTVTINGLVYTAVSGARANNTEFSIDTGDNECALDLAAAITADTRTGTDTFVDQTATSASAIVTATNSAGSGSGGNAITLVSSNGTRLAVSASTFSGGTSWSTSDKVYFDGVSSVKSATTGLLQRNAAASLFEVTEDYTGDIGVSGTFLVFGGSASGPYIHRGSGTFYLDSRDITPLVVVDSDNLVNAMVYAPLFGAAGDLIVESGFVTYGASAIDSSITCSGPLATIDIQSSATQLNDLRVLAGRVNNRRKVTGSSSTFLVSGGVVIHTSGAVTSYVQTGGAMEWNTTDTMTLGWMFGGTLDFNQTRQAKTITALTISGGSQLFTNDNVTITTLRDLRNVNP